VHRRILRRIAPGSFEENGGLFVALTDEDMDYKPDFLAGCAACGIPTRELRPAEALLLEPGLNPTLKAAVWVPDATMDAMRLPLRFFATARLGGAQLRPFTEVTGLLQSGRRITGVVTHDHVSGVDAELEAELVVNATGPWCERLAALAGAAVPVQLSPGVLLALSGRLCNLVVNRLHRAGDGDIVGPSGPCRSSGPAPGPWMTLTTSRCPTSTCRRCTGRGPSWSRRCPRPPSGPPGRRPGR
jgi:glycerol-3-phosphate dehydrogenase